ncbi:MAG: sulfotransferase family protein [Chloroflexota bacterium]|nr:sulfotransferase family protein [Chloroflexota bacterium]
MQGNRISAGDGASVWEGADTPASTLEVVGAGFGRTGTLSLRAALERLGVDPCDHMEQTLAQPERVTLWQDAAARRRDGQPVDWRPLLEGYRATVDWPAAAFWRELSAAHPHARVILTVRDPGRWYDSMAATLFPLHRRVEQSPWARLLLDLTGLANPALRGGYHLTHDLVWREIFEGRFADRAHALRVFRAHQREVCAAIPPERLLVFDVAQGWEPLCAFLGKPVPQGEPFPHVNDTRAFQRRARDEALRQGLRFGAPTLAGAAGLVVLLRAMWRDSQGRRGAASTAPMPNPARRLPLGARSRNGVP